MATLFDNEEKALPLNMQSLVPSWLDFLRRVFSKRYRAEATQYTPQPRPSVSQPSAGTVGAHTHTAPYVLPDSLDGPLAADDKLATYRRITGITSAREHKGGYRPASNLGIYARVVKNERQALDAYKFTSRFINCCLALQLIVAATLTALGAGNGPHAAVTVFGAINTIIAGFLTYLKGSGLPNRHKFYASSWGKVREYMEQREREFEREDCPLDVEEVVKKVEHMYEEVRQDVQANEPEAYTSTSQLKRNEGLSPGPQISDRTGEFGYSPGPTGNRMTTMTDERISAFGKNTRSQPSGEDRNFSFNGSKMPTKGGDRSSGLEEKLHNLGADTPPSVLGRRNAEDEAALLFMNTQPIHEAHRQIHAAMDAGAAMMEEAKHMEAGIKEELEALTAGFESHGAARSKQASAAVPSAIEKERLQAAKAIGESADRLKEAGEQRLNAARTMKARVDDALRSPGQNVQKTAEDPTKSSLYG
ncbi:hypothetical protein MMC11_000721 [Xylographa trunciseda]|nr:hypothetical protein [Xylographa trunciseda]